MPGSTPEAFYRLVRHRIFAILGEVPPDERGRLLRPRQHDTLLGRQRARIIIGRVRMIALLLAVLTPLWIIMDVIFFPREQAQLLALGRVIISLAFLGLAVGLRNTAELSRGWVALGLLFAIPTVFYVFSHALIGSVASHGAAAAAAAGYAFLPFVMMAGLSVFPLTAVEALIYALPMLLAKALMAALDIATVDWGAQYSALWLLGLITLVAASASLSQLHFMAQLVERSSRDPLTGCINRAHGEELLKRQAALARRDGAPMTVAFIDLDRFKAINDDYGHEVGDAALYQAAHALRRRLRETDLLIRWGGEEFLILFPNTPLPGAEGALRRLLLDGLGYRPDGSPLTASAGLAELTEAEVNGSLEELISAADQRMYAVKADGGNAIGGAGTERLAARA
ncbi:GGDEF domain-containing protein [Halorhodospira halophila]|uniref:diguanylate cyclase n=1 Tax=Halorhodospira halophila (strain DSM 244 / SL1) TaxID=349124 RepID=A1WWV0_HALHL|nr:GGDEF domain-containing protein [Halorhodospira halophila]ABM62162.1 diguanylate cyclase [Halorhodospira halophila SL1]MBK1729490.1 GGDEF domain-containing protein [Halorhodospira halophila]